MIKRFLIGSILLSVISSAMIMLTFTFKTGDVIAFNDLDDILFIDLRTEIIWKLTDDISAGFPAWSPDGREIVFLGDEDGTALVYAIQADGRNLRLLTPIDPEETYNYLPYQQPYWSSDGKRVIALRQTVSGMQLFSVDVQNGDIQAIDQGSDDGQDYILQLDTASGRVPNSNERIYVDDGLMLAGERLTSSDSWILAHFSWATDGERVAFIEDWQQRVLRVVNVNTGATRMFDLSEYNAYNPAWRP